MANPGNGLRTVNSLMMEISFHLVEQVVATTLSIGVAPGLQTVGVSSTNGMYVGAQVVVANPDGTLPTIFTITGFDPVGLTVTGVFAIAYPPGSTMLGGTFPTQQPSDPLFTQVEILDYIARSQNEFLAKIPYIFQFFNNFPILLGQTFQTLPPTAIELERVALQTNQVTATITTISRLGNMVTATLSAPSSLTSSITVSGVIDASFDGIFTLTGQFGNILTWNQTAVDANSTGGSVSSPILTRLYEVSQQQLTMRDPNWFFNTSNPTPTSWYEDRTGSYGWGVAGVPQSNFTGELIASVRDSETLLLTDGFLVPDIMLHYVKYRALSYIWDKAGEQRAPTQARMAQKRFDRGVMIADRYLRSFIEAPTQGGQ